MTKATRAFKLFRKYIVYKLKSRHRKGFGIHSPFLFALVNKNFREECSVTVKNGAIAYKKALKNQNLPISRSNFGAGSLLDTSKKPSLPYSINRAIGMPRKHGELLWKLSKQYGANGTLELGTGLGSSTYYLAAGTPEGKLVTIEGHKEYAKVAERILKQTGVSSIEYRTGSFTDELNKLKNENAIFGLFFIDGDHTYAATLNHFESCLNIATLDAVIIIDDIHWSDEMSQAWEAIKTHSRCAVSIDLFRFGVVFTNQKFQNQHYIVRY